MVVGIRADLAQGRRSILLEAYRQLVSRSADAIREPSDPIGHQSCEQCIIVVLYCIQAAVPLVDIYLSRLDTKTTEEKAFEHIREPARGPPGVQFEKALLQVAPVDKSKCPLMRDTNDVEFQLFTRYNPTVYQELVIGDDDKLLASNINFHDPTVIYFHAFMELPDENSGLLVREAYMLRGNSNVIMVDASRLEAGPWYFTAAENTWYIGRFAAKFIDYLVSRGLDLSKTHLIGHSLGGQSAGVAGGSLKTGRVSRITGLDPALPLFANLPLDQRLDPSDAHFVDVIHTDAGIFGVKTPTGHADFYPNGGISPQPGCELEVVVPQQFLLNKFFCSHWRSYMYYAESVLRPRSFAAAPCASRAHYERGACAPNYAHMGYAASPDNFTGCLTLHAETQQCKHCCFTAGLASKMVVAIRADLAQGDRHTKPQGYYKFDLKPKKHGKKQKTHKHRKVHLNPRDTTLGTTREEFTVIDTKRQALHKTKTQKSSSLYSIAESGVKNTVPKGVMTPENDIKPTDAGTRHLNKNNNNNDSIIHRKTDTSATEKSSKPDTIHAVRLYSTDKTSRQTNVEESSPDTPSALYSMYPIETVGTSHVKKRQKRFLPFFKRSEATESDNFFFKILEFVNKNRKSVIPVFTVVREINTLVKSANGELNHSSKERNNYIGHNPPISPLVTYNLELGSDSKAKAFVKRLLGLKVEGDRLTIAGK
ncbi:hypothetical protein MSG28_014786 [Choristoneura fumiferana]|uniref:Uncharacterized protein n=1 Tax=Choristoneura fumiferana TaxID=7141 RepID=A0ACC0JSP4_CHOFU|nr:hypothetical protein MSG28_014786 [Choristoneura fumiferana]